MRLTKKSKAAAAAASNSNSSSSNCIPASTSTSSNASSALSIRSTKSTLSLRTLSGSLNKMIIKALPNSLKRRRDELEDESYEHIMFENEEEKVQQERQQRNAVFLAATSELVRRSTTDSRPAHVVAQREEEWHEVGIDVLLSAGPSIYPALPSLQAPLPSSPADVEMSEASAETPKDVPASASIRVVNAPAVASSVAPPTVTSDGFQDAMAELNARLLAKGKNTQTLQDAVANFQTASASRSPAAGGSSSALSPPAKRSVADRFKSTHEKLFKKSDSIASHYATFRGSKTKVSTARIVSSTRKGQQINGPSSSRQADENDSRPVVKRARLSERKTEANLRAASSNAKPAAGSIKVSRPNPRPTPLSTLAQPKHAAPPIRRSATTSTLSHKPSISMLKGKASATSLRPQPSGSSLKTAATSSRAAVNTGSVRIGPKQARALANEASGTTAASEKTQSNSSLAPAEAKGSTQPTLTGPIPTAFVGPSIVNIASAHVKSKYIDVLATPPRPLNSTNTASSKIAASLSMTLPRSSMTHARPALPTVAFANALPASPLKQLFSSASATVLSALATPPRPAPLTSTSTSSGSGAASVKDSFKFSSDLVTQRTRTNGRGEDVGPTKTSIAANRTEARFHPYSSGTTSSSARGAVARSAGTDSGKEKSAGALSASTLAGALSIPAALSPLVTPASTSTARGSSSSSTSTLTGRGVTTTMDAGRRPRIDRAAVMRRARAAREAGDDVEMKTDIDERSRAADTGAEDVEMSVDPVVGPHEGVDLVGPTPATGLEDVTMSRRSFPDAPTHDVAHSSPRPPSSSSSASAELVAEAPQPLALAIGQVPVGMASATAPLNIKKKKVARIHTPSESMDASIDASRLDVPSAPKNETKTGARLSTMLTASSSVPETVTLSTGLSARIPDKKRKAATKGTDKENVGDRSGPRPLPPPPAAIARVTAAAAAAAGSAATAPATTNTKGRRVPSGSSRARTTGAGASTTAKRASESGRAAAVLDSGRDKASSAAGGDGDAGGAMTSSASAAGRVTRASARLAAKGVVVA